MAAEAQADAVLEVSGLSVVQQRRRVLDGVTFEVQRGTTLAIVGPNGSGKTTLFRALLGIVPYTGKVRWESGVRIGYVPQTLVTTDLPITVAEFLRLKCRTDLAACVGAVGLGSQILTQRLGSLSGGELQRVLISWAIVDRPSVLLFDEPTSGVDIGVEEPIYNRIDSLKREFGITVLLISHNLHVVANYSTHLLALNGRAVFFGESRAVTHSRLIGLMYGGGAGTPEEAGDEAADGGRS